MLCTYFIFHRFINFHPQILSYSISISSKKRMVMPTRRETDATEALIGLNNNLQPYTSILDDDVSDLVLGGDDTVHNIDPTVVGNYIELPTFEAERFFGSTVESSSTSTPADTPSDESRELLSNILPLVSGTLLDKKRASKRNAKSGIWKFF